MTNKHEITRRSLLAQMGALASIAALGAGTTVALANTTPRPEYEDLTRYYAFLWSEFQRLSEEMGVDMHDSMTAHRNGDVDALKGALPELPSTRAMTVLATIAADRNAVVSVPMRHCNSRPDADERGRTKLRRAAQDIRSAMTDLGHRDFMVFVKDDPSGGRIAKVINFEAGGETYAFA